MDVAIIRQMDVAIIRQMQQLRDSDAGEQLMK